MTKRLLSFLNCSSRRESAPTFAANQMERTHVRCYKIDEEKSAFGGDYGVVQVPGCLVQKIIFSVLIPHG